MALPYTLATLTAGNQPLSKLDANFSALGAISTIPCTATGTNAYTLTAAAGTPTVTSYNQLQAFRAVIPAASTGAVTVGQSSPGLLPCYKPSVSGPVAAGAGDVVIGEAYDFVYDVSLNGGSGGFHVFNVIPAGSTAAFFQMVNSQTGAVATGTNTIPVDDTIPQNTEGDQYLSLSITPTSATHHLLILVHLNFGFSSANTNITAALFQDTTADALAVGFGRVYSGGEMQAMGFMYYMAAGTTSATTFKVRAGGAAAGTFTLNGFGGARKFGGVSASGITIMEVA